MGRDDEPKPSRRIHDRIPQEIRDYIDEAADRGAEKAVAGLSSKVRGWIEAAGERGGEIGSDKAIAKIFAEIGKAGFRKTLLFIGAALAALVSWLGFSPHLPK